MNKYVTGDKFIMTTTIHVIRGRDKILNRYVIQSYGAFTNEKAGPVHYQMYEVFDKWLASTEHKFVSHKVDIFNDELAGLIDG